MNINQEILKLQEEFMMLDVSMDIRRGEIDTLKRELKQAEFHIWLLQICGALVSIVAIAGVFL